MRQYIEQNHPVQGTTRPLAGLPARAFTTAVNGGALARIQVASSPMEATVDLGGVRTWYLVDGAGDPRLPARPASPVRKAER